MELRKIPRFPRYLAGSDGKIYSEMRPKLRKLKDRKSWSPGYFSVSIKCQKSGKFKPVNVHVLICEAFHGERPPGAVTRHLDGDRKNNLPSNLRWGTWRENHKDTRDHGRLGSGTKAPNHFFKSTHELAHATALFAFGLTPKEVALIVGCSTSTVHNLIQGKYYKKETASAVSSK